MFKFLTKELFLFFIVENLHGQVLTQFVHIFITFLSKIDPDALQPSSALDSLY
jgi:hypothetical protein